MFTKGFQSTIEYYSRGRKWWAVLPVWVLTVYLFVELLFYNPNASSSILLVPARSVLFTIHEVTHFLLDFAPEVLSFAAGSIAEMVFALVVVMAAGLSRNLFLSCVLWVWLFMLAFMNAGTYMADARAQRLELVNIAGADRSIHDWNYVFGQLDILEWDRRIGYTVKAMGMAGGTFGILLGFSLVYKMYENRYKSKIVENDEVVLLEELKHRPAATSETPAQPKRERTKK